MMSKVIHFLAGLPRTGSTLLGSILGQHPLVHVTPTSPFYPLLVDVNESFNRLSVQHTYDHDGVSGRVYRSLAESFYADRSEPVVFDKHRGWPRCVSAVRQFVNPDPRIVATVRPIPEIITSYIVLADADPNNFIDKHLRQKQVPVSNEARAHLLWSDFLRHSYESLQTGLRDHPECILLVEYDDIVFRPEETLGRICDFCGLPTFRPDLEEIKNTCAEAKDDAWGMKNLHTIRPSLSRRSADPYDHLPAAAVEWFAAQNIGEVACA